MSETYESRIEEITRRLPAGPCLVALVPTIARDQAAAIAGDLAQLLARGRSGHTLLLSLEDPPAALDHEIGVEGGPGLTEILAGRATLAEVAAHGRARGYIFVPAGEGAAPGRALAASPAFRTLCESAVSRGGTVLAFVSADALPPDPPPTGRGIVWLGPEAETRRPSSWPTIGSLLPPGPPPSATSAGPPSAGVETEAATDPSEVVDPGTEAGTGKGVGADADEREARIRRRTRRRRSERTPGLLVLLLAVAVVLSLALTVYALLRPRPMDPLLPENDTLWLSPP